jgi:hypothetical protein
VLNPAQCNFIAGLCDDRPSPGKRLAAGDLEPIADLIAAGGAIGDVAARLIGSAAKPVRALLLNKSEAANWRIARLR